MTNEEIARDYRQAKDGLKQAKILADLNQCSKEKIVEILQEQGVKVDGRLLQKGKPKAPARPKAPTPKPAAPDPDSVNHPQHYTRGGIECIDAIAAAVQDLPGKEAWLVGQIIKYVWRYKWKNGAEDLEKARFYLDRLIGEVKV
jgi:hypothetical protein